MVVAQITVFSLFNPARRVRQDTLSSENWRSIPPTLPGPPTDKEQLFGPATRTEAIGIYHDYSAKICRELP